jgi:hypothetical protein
MHIKVMLQTSHIGDVEKPIPAPDEDDDDDSPTSYAAAVLTDSEMEAVRVLLGKPLPAPRGSDRRNLRYRVETPGGRVAVTAMRQLTTTNWSHFRAILRSLAMGPVELVFNLMRAGNLHLLLSFGQTWTVTISEEQRQRIAEHVPEVQVYSSPADLQRFLTEKVEAWQRLRPEWFQETWMELMDDADDAGRTMQKDREPASGNSTAFWLPMQTTRTSPASMSCAARRTKPWVKRAWLSTTTAQPNDCCTRKT